VKLLTALSLPFLVSLAISHAQATPHSGRPAGDITDVLHLVGNTSSNSSSNTSSNQSSGRSSYVHTHSWSVDSDDDSIIRGTRIERYSRNRVRPYDHRRHNRGDDD
jgi:hypothetical protein